MRWLYPDGIRVVRLVRDSHNPLIIPVALTGNRNAPGVVSLPEWLIQEWDAAWAQVQFLQLLLQAYQGKGDAHDNDG